MTTHSQLPWKLEDADCIIDNRGKTTAVCVNEFSEANASFIVRCVNNHAKLVKVCKKALQNIKEGNPRLSTAFVTDLLEQAIQSQELVGVTTIADIEINQAISTITELVKRVILNDEEIKLFIESKMGGVLPKEREWMLSKLAEDLRSEILKRVG
jgi:hypothetical protein